LLQSKRVFSFFPGVDKDFDILSPPQIVPTHDSTPLSLFLLLSSPPRPILFRHTSPRSKYLFLCFLKMFNPPSSARVRSLFPSFCLFLTRSPSTKAIPQYSVQTIMFLIVLPELSFSSGRPHFVIPHPPSSFHSRCSIRCG